MGKARDLIKEVMGNGKEGMIDSLLGWQSIMEESAAEVHNAFDRLERALKTEDPKQVERSVGFFHGTIEKLTKNAGDVKHLTQALIDEVKDPDFWKNGQD